MDNTTAKEVHHKPSVDQNQRFRKDKPQPVFQEFSWHEGGAQTSTEHLIEWAHDISNGICTVMGLIEESDVLLVDGESPLVSPVNRGHLTRLIVTSARMLADACSQNIEAANEGTRRQMLRAGGQQ